MTSEVCTERVERNMSALDLYLDLLKSTLTATVFDKEPNPDDESYAEFLAGFIDHYIEGRAVSMLPRVRMDNIRFCTESVIRNNVPGDLIETGVWRGGAAIFMRGILKAYQVSNRRVWVADSFEGLPAPDPGRFPVEAAAHSGTVMTDSYRHFRASLEEVQGNFARFGLLDEQVVFLKGWFRETLPSAPIEQLAVLRLDGDYYESTMDSLVNLYDKVPVGGYIIVDDYGEESWTYCKQAVEEFRRQRGIEDAIIRVDSHCHYWQRASHS